MKKALFVIGPIVLLAAVVYGVQYWMQIPTVVYHEYTATYNSDTPEIYKTDLMLAIQRVVKTKISAIGAPLESIEVGPVNNGVLIVIATTSDVPIEKITKALSEPYDFQLMKSVPVEEAYLIVNAETDNAEGYKPTAIANKSLTWVESAALDNGNGAVRIILSSEAQTALQDLYSTIPGEAVGVFVRNQLIAKLLVTSEELHKDIRILNVPDPSISQLFADDMNVGRYISFSQ